jgi:hypothetical protein
VHAPTTIATYLHPWEPEISRGLLESEGIAARLADENIVRMDWSHALAVGGVRLQVPMESVAAARLVLERQKNGEFEEALENEHGVAPAACRNCGSRSLRPTHSARWILLLVLSFGIAAIFPPPRNGTRCKGCGQVQQDANSGI